MLIRTTILPLCCGWLLLFQTAASAQTKRARDYGVPFDGTPGPYNAITDVAGVTVGQTTLISGDGPLVKGKRPVRTGVNAILPRWPVLHPLYPHFHALNGN